MKIAVITPYYKEHIDVLRQCHQGVLSQSISADHFFIADGHPNQELMSWNVKHTTLSQAHADNGNTPRGIGSVLANIEGYDFISYLDADNWFHSDHLSSLINLWNETRADVCSSFRTMHDLSGKVLLVKDKDELSLKHIDTSCYLLHRNAFDAVDIWLKMPKILSPICDRIFFAGLKHRKYSFASTKKSSVAFRSQYKVHYVAAKITPPPDAKVNVGQESYAWLHTIAGIKETVKTLGFVPL